MNKIGMVLGAAAIVTLAGCKDPDYKYETASDSQNDVKVVGEAPSSEVKPLEVTPIEVKSTPSVAETPVAPIPPETIKPAPAPAPAPAAKPAAPENTTYVVRSGDSLSKISKRHNVTISSIKRLNPSLKGDVIRIGQKLVLPGKLDVGAQPAPAAKKTLGGSLGGAVREYVVKAGDSLGKIAHEKGVSVRQLKEANGLKKDTIRVGQKLKLPAEKVAVRSAAQAGKKTVVKKAAEAVTKKAEAKKDEVKNEAKAPAVAPAPADAEKTVAAPAENAQGAEATAVSTEEKPSEAARQEPSKTPTYTVQEGDDMTGVSIRWGVSAAAIRELNNLGDNDQLKPGQVIKLPSDAQQ